MTFLEPVATVNDEGISNIPAPAQHQHRLFDAGVEIPVNAPATNKFPDKPLKVYKAGNFALLDGVIDLTGVPAGAFTIGNIPDPEYRPWRNLTNFAVAGFSNAAPGNILYGDMAVGASVGNIVVVQVAGPPWYDELHINSFIWRVK